MVNEVKRKNTLKRAPVAPVQVPPAPEETSFGGLVKELNSPTSYVAKLNRTKEFMEGFETSRQGRAKGRNPYGMDTMERDEWDSGWECKFYGEAL